MESTKTYRPCDAQTILNQIGFWTRAEIVANHVYKMVDKNQEDHPVVGIEFVLKNGRAIQVRLGWTDLYEVTSHRVVLRGKNIGKVIEGPDASEVFAENLSEVVRNVYNKLLEV